MPHELREGPTPASVSAAPDPAPAAAPPIAGDAAPDASARPPRSPSWLRALLLSLVVLAAGSALGAAGYHLERAYYVQAPEMTKTSDGWRIIGRHGPEFSGLALSGPRLLWKNGPSIEYADLDEGWVRLLGPGAGMRTTWEPSVGERYAIWFEAERPESFAARAVAYDTRSGRRWTVADIGSIYSYPSLSGETAAWCSARQIASPAVWGVRIGSGDTFEVAPGYGAPVVSGSLVVWATSARGPFTARELGSGTSWPVTVGLTRDELTAIALSGRTLVWGQGSAAAGSGVVAAASVDGGATRTLAAGVTGLAGPAYDGVTVVWAERVAAPGGTSAAAAGSRVMGRRLGGDAAFIIAEVDGVVTEVAVSGGTVAWIVSLGGSYEIETRELPR